MYTITHTDREYARLADARKFATKTAARENCEIEVRHSETGTVAFVTSPREIAKREQGVHFVPWTRLENPKFAAPAFDGWYPAYTRKRIEATVYRSYDGEAPLPWRVHDGRTGGHLDVRSTKAACKLTKEMGQGRTL